MRITHVVRSDSFAGVERYICDVTTELARLGHEVQVIGGDPARMEQELPSSVIWWPARTTAEAGRALTTGGRRHIVHVHMTAAELAGVLTRPAHRSRIVSTRHFAATRGSSVVARIAGYGIRAGIDAEIAISDFVARAAEGCPRVLYNGVRDAPQSPLDEPVAVLLQRLEPEKQANVALQAWAASTLAHTGWTLLIAGQGQLEGELRALVYDLGLAESVQFLGQIRDTGTLLSRASIMIAPAPAEPFGLSVVEAMARGVPVVAAAGGAHRETVETEDLLFPEGDVKTLAALLDGLGTDVDHRRKVGRWLRQRQQALFRLQGHVAELITVYAALLRRR